MEILSDTVFKGTAQFINGIHLHSNPSASLSSGVYIDNSEFSLAGGRFFSNKNYVTIDCSLTLCVGGGGIQFGDGSQIINLKDTFGTSEFGSGFFYLPEVEADCTKFSVKMYRNNPSNLSDMRFCNREDAIVGYFAKNVNTGEQVMLKSVDIAHHSNTSTYRLTTEFVVEKNAGMAIPVCTYKVTVFGARVNRFSPKLQIAPGLYS